MNTTRIRQHTRRRLGLTMVELLIAVGITLGIAFGAMTLFSSASQLLVRGSTDMDNNDALALAMARISSEVRSAILIQVNDTGTTLTYWVPVADDSGQPVIPMQMSPTPRTFQVSDGQLIWSMRPNAPLVTGLVSTDPETGQAVRPFSNPFGDAAMRCVDVNLVMRVVPAEGPARLARLHGSYMPRNQAD